jgi:hypothetical protein
MYLRRILKLIVRKLVSFETRHSLSDTISTATKGIGAARNWIKSELERYSQGLRGAVEGRIRYVYAACRRSENCQSDCS